MNVTSEGIRKTTIEELNSIIPLHEAYRFRKEIQVHDVGCEGEYFWLGLPDGSQICVSSNMSKELFESFVSEHSK